MDSDNSGSRSARSVPCMQGGGGAGSYAANSSYQIHAFHAYAKPHLAEAVRLAVDNLISRAGSISAAPIFESKKAAVVTDQALEEEESGASHCSNNSAGALIRHEYRNDNNSLYHVAVADLGCSYGENALVYAQFIVHALTQGFLGLTNQSRNDTPNTRNHTPNTPSDQDQPALQRSMIKVPDLDHTTIEDRVMMEIQYFFSDLPSNDFNHLFRSLAASPTKNHTLLTCSSTDDHQLTCTRVYPAGVPGSFYNRLFPSRSLNFVCCAFALHWLSQVPPDALDKSSPSWNGGHIWIWGDGQRPEVAQAFARQSKADLIHFFKCRVEEMDTNAILFLFVPACNEDRDYLNHYNFMGCGFVESTWTEMVNEGLISCEERDTFNIPQYIFNRKELQLALKEVPELKILKLEVIEDLTQQPENHSFLKDPQAFGKTWAKFVQSVLQPMIEAHIGLQRTRLFFERLERVTTKKACLTGTNLELNYLIAICQRC